MGSKKRFKRDYIILEAKDINFRNKERVLPKAFAKVEVNDGKSIVALYVENLKYIKDGYDTMAITTKHDVLDLGKIILNEQGRGEFILDLGDTEDDIKSIAILYEDKVPLIGFKGNKLDNYEEILFVEEEYEEDEEEYEEDDERYEQEYEEEEEYAQEYEEDEEEYDEEYEDEEYDGEYTQEYDEGQEYVEEYEVEDNVDEGLEVLRERDNTEEFEAEEEFEEEPRDEDIDNENYREGDVKDVDVYEAGDSSFDEGNNHYEDCEFRDFNEQDDNYFDEEEEEEDLFDDDGEEDDFERENHIKNINDNLYLNENKSIDEMVELNNFNKIKYRQKYEEEIIDEERVEDKIEDDFDPIKYVNNRKKAKTKSYKIPQYEEVKEEINEQNKTAGILMMPRQIKKGLKYFKEVKPFADDKIDSTRWWKIDINPTTLCGYSMPNLGYVNALNYTMYSDVVINAYKHKHYLFGVQYDEYNKREHYIYAIPGVKNEKPDNGNTGFIRFQNSDTRSNNNKGYWMCFIDSRLRTIVK